ncbi:hypothetical protein KFL_007380030 [Klebsormidium nitens]|uniref:C2H2-type domain-containing protein n=1 Tax=Klebsormidium nitens TaxID=105231 RepID=A0A1Y1ISL5_KLENI|nr:hypothetical protein KFL_007380030 [Klebsormidium nitens]|eukprot:GAQ91168.1 hypothetical protein KFL_007380030 [Klebsormidium nitens]
MVLERGLGLERQSVDFRAEGMVGLLGLVQLVAERAPWAAEQARPLCCHRGHPSVLELGWETLLGLEWGLRWGLQLVWVLDSRLEVAEGGLVADLVAGSAVWVLDSRLEVAEGSVSLLAGVGESSVLSLEAGCGALLKRGDTLLRHERTHNDEKALKCSYYMGCNAAFARRDTLTLHERTHSGIKPFACSEAGCDEAFSRSDALKTHVFYYHTEKGQQRRKREEERIAKLLTTAGLPFKREHHVTFDCLGGSFARIDFILDHKGKIIVIEVDEYQHEGYGVACDVARMLQIYEAWAIEGNSLPVHIIRYNPHTFQIDGKRAAVTRKIREARLLEAINEAAEMESEGLDQPRRRYHGRARSGNQVAPRRAFVGSGQGARREGLSAELRRIKKERELEAEMNPSPGPIPDPVIPDDPMHVDPIPALEVPNDPMQVDPQVAAQPVVLQPSWTAKERAYESTTDGPQAPQENR